LFALRSGPLYHWALPIKEEKRSQACRYTPLIPALRWLRQEDFKYKDNLCYITNSRPACVKEKGKNNYKRVSCSWKATYQCTE
jgi:hypothetical protein